MNAAEVMATDWPRARVPHRYTTDDAMDRMWAAVRPILDAGWDWAVTVTAEQKVQVWRRERWEVQQPGTLLVAQPAADDQPARLWHITPDQQQVVAVEESVRFACEGVDDPEVRAVTEALVREQGMIYLDGMEPDEAAEIAVRTLRELANARQGTDAHRSDTEE